MHPTLRAHFILKREKFERRILAYFQDNVNTGARKFFLVARDRIDPKFPIRIISEYRRFLCVRRFVELTPDRLTRRDAYVTLFWELECSLAARAS